MGGKLTGGAVSKPTGGYTKKTNVLGATTSKGNATALKNQTTAAYDDDAQGKIPRRANPNGFQAIHTPDNQGSIKSYHGGKMKNGVIYYPDGVQVDFGMAARNQAFVDYSYGESTSGNASMGKVYGDAYYNELRRLDELPVGAPAWGYKDGTGGGAGVTTDRLPNVLGAYTDTPNGLGGYEDALREAEEAAAEALRRQTAQGVDGIYAQKDPLGQQYKDAAQQAYIAQMMGKRTLPQQMAAQGLSGGATESANVALETNYGNSLNDLTNTYNQGLASIDRDAANMQATGDISIAQNSAQYGMKMADAALQAQMQAEQLRQQKELAAYNAQIQRQQQEAAWKQQTGQNSTAWERELEMMKLKNEMEYDSWLKQQQYKAGAKARSTSDDGDVNFVGNGNGYGDIYESIVNSQQLSDYEKKRRLNANGMLYNR